MLTGFQPEEGPSRSSRITKLGNNCQTANCSTSLNSNVVLRTFTGGLLAIEAIFLKNAYVQQILLIVQ